MLVQTASQYESKIYLETDGKRVNAKSIMGMMTLGLAAGGMIKVEADGTDEEQAVAQIEKYLTNQEAECVLLQNQIDGGSSVV